MVENRQKRIAVFPRLLAVAVALVVAWAMFALGMATTWAQTDDRSAVGQDLTVAAGEEVKGDAVVTNGNLTVLGEVDGDAVVVNGKATIVGQVHGDLTVTSGDVNLGASSRVDGNVLVVAGQVVKANGAHVGGDITAPQPSLANGLSNNIVAPPAPGEPVAPSEPNARDLTSVPSGVFGGLLDLFAKGMVSLALLVLGMGLTAVVPRRVSVSSATLDAEPVSSLIMGLITSFLLVPVVIGLTLVLVISIIGAFLLPVLAIAVGGALLFGLVTVGAWIGGAVYDSMHHAYQASNNHLFLKVLIGMSIVLGTTFVPSILLPNSVTVLMLTLLYFASCVGIASAILSRFGTLAPPKHAHLYHRVQVQGTPAMYNPVSHAVAPPPPVESPVRQQGAPEQQPPVP